MNESLDISRVADELSAAGIHSATTQKLADTVRSRGVAAAACVGASDWQSMRLMNRIVAEFFDAGMSRNRAAATLELVAQLQDVMGQVTYALADRRTVGR